MVSRILIPDSIKYILIFLVASTIVGLVSIGCQNQKVKNNTVRLPKAYFILGIFFIICFSLPIAAYISTNDFSQPEMLIFFGVFFVLCFLMAVAQINWGIVYSDQGFTYRTMFRHKMEYTYSDIQKFKRFKGGTIMIRVKGRCLFFDPYVVGFQGFIKAMNKNRRID